MTLMQAVLIGIIYFLAISTLSGGVGFFTFNKPLVAGFFVGLILGDPCKGTEIGAAVNLLYIGNMSTGGTLPSDMTLAAILAATLGINSGISTEAVITLAVPVGILGTLLWVGRLTIDTIFVQVAAQMIKKGKGAYLWIVNVLLPQTLLFAVSAIPLIIMVYWGMEYVERVINYLGNTFLNAITIVGSMLPAVGLAMTLKSVFRGRAKVYFLIGFLLIQYFSLNTISIGIVAAIFAVLVYQNSEQKAIAIQPIKPEEKVSDKKILSKKDLIRSCFIWEVQAQACYNYQNMQGLGFAHAMVPIMKKLYGINSDEFKHNLLKHMEFFNVAPQFAAMIPGIVVALEEKKALGNDQITDESIVAVKTSLMGPISGIGDTVIQGVLVPLLLSVFVGVSMNGNVAGPILYGIIITAIMLAINYYSFMFGYTKGSTAILRFLQGGLINRVVDAAMIMGCTVIGGLVAQYVNLRSGVQINVSDDIFDLQTQLFDAVLPGILPLILTLLCYKCINKGISINRILLGILVIGVFGSISGILV